MATAAAALVAALLALAAAPAAADATGRAQSADVPAAATTAAATTAEDVPAADSRTDVAGTERAAPTAAPTATPTPPPGLPQSGLSPAPTPSPAPSDPPTSAPAVDPTIADPGDVTSATGRFSGTATPGHGVRVMDPAVASRSVCTATADANGAWSCLGRVRTGPHQVFTVQDTSDPARHTADAPAADVVVPPTIRPDGPTAGNVSGTGDAGMTVTVSVTGSAAQGSATDRTAVVGPDGRWIVSWSTGASPRPDGTVSMTATQTASTALGFRSDLRSAASQPVAVTIDRTAPDAPRVTDPRAGSRVTSQPLTIRGQGEPGATLTAYVDRAPVCGATVRQDGSWSCTAERTTLTPGRHSVSALQHDAAGNHSRPSDPVPVTVSATATSTPGSASPTPGSGATGGASGTGMPGPGGASGSGTPGTGAPGSGTDGTGTGGSGADGGASGTTGFPGGRDWSGPAGDWSAATAFDQTVPTIQSSFSWRTLVVAVAVVAGFLLLVAGPARLVARSLRGRTPFRLGSVTGRNRPRGERSRGDDALPSWASVALAVPLAALLTLLGVGVELEARYVRLAIAVLVGAAVLAAAVVLATRWAAGADRHTVRFRVSPWLVLAALVACGVTRSADLSPALVVGALIVPAGRVDVDTAAMRLGSDVAACARSATWRSLALLVVAVAGWVLHSLTPGSGFWVSLASEFAITLCVGGLGSLVVTLLPLTRSAGSALWSHSRVRYASIAAVGVALAAAVYSGSAGTHLPPVAVGVAAVACAATAVAAWLWVRVAGRDARA
ncbi:Ig-like domain-containing protein [Curtobacterium sp. 9128]|uniref:Ig-like domain-containing protein n=1 Tax=Curtobacterium sp. 9128 TaxID=1793722 RepID=UPI0011A8BDBC|nr:Ig-like domain-containing protein [Curtobacterium sp. 9128]